MAKILVYGYPSDWNFGGPSIILGFRELVRTCRPDDEMVCYESARLTPTVVAGYDFKVCAFPYSRVGAFWRDWFVRTVFRRLPSKQERREFWLDFADADTVVNLSGICFCSGQKVIGGPFVGLRALKTLLKLFSPNLAARLAGKRSVKSTCSYGPATRVYDMKAARYASRAFFGVMLAREQGSAQRLREMSGGRVDPPVAPDVANLMPTPAVDPDDRLVGIVVSYKMEQEWKRDEISYVDCMAALADHVREAHGCRVVLIPNQDGYLAGRRLRRGDTDVARDIYARISRGQGVSVAETLGRPALETKALIARCTALVSPRYHACVAALTAGIPLLTLGWHEKYKELTSLYGQGRWMIPAEDCSFARLACDFDALMAARGEVSDVIRSKKGMIHDAVVNSGKIMLGDGLGSRAGTEQRPGAAFFMRLAFAVAVGAFLCFAALPIWMHPKMLLAPRQGTSTVQERVKANILKKYQFKDFFVDLNGGVTRLALRRICNERIRCRNGMLVEQDQCNVPSDFGDGISKFGRWLDGRGIPFVFVLIPCKGDVGGRMFPEGFSCANRNVSAQMEARRLQESASLKVLDLVPEFAGTETAVASNYFHTDHHWKFRAALRAASLVADALAEMLHEPKLKGNTNLQSENWVWKRLPHQFLGSDGRRTGALFAGSDEFEYAFPKFKTDMVRRCVKGNGYLRPGKMDEVFSGEYRTVELDWRYAKQGRGNWGNNYGMFAGSDRAVQLHVNKSAPVAKRIMIIKDSFGNPVVAGLTTVFREIVQVDPRKLDGVASLPELVEAWRPSAVVEMCNPSVVFATSRRKKFHLDCEHEGKAL